MRIKVLDEYTIGNSALAHDDIIIGDNCGRWIPLDREGLPDIIAALTHFVHFTQETVNPSEFERRGKELDVDETLEGLIEATYLEEGLLYWKVLHERADALPSDIYARLVSAHEGRE